MNSLTYITVRTAVPGLHHWPQAPDRRDYLRNLHRHLFKVEVAYEVGHDDRDVEYHDLQEVVRGAFKGMGRTHHHESSLLTFGPRSCEALARELREALVALGYKKVLAVTVSEDGECDATVEWGV